MFMAAHLVNTFFLVAALTLTAWWLSGAPGVAVRARPARSALIAALAAGLVLAGMSGAIAALGDTLFPAASHAEGLRATLSASSHALLRLRALHPLLAVLAGTLVMFVAPRLAEVGDEVGQRLGRVVVIVAGVQLIGGLINVLLLAPIWMQIVHLLVADLLWIAFVLLGAHVLRAAGPEQQRQSSAA
jgi:cytochrome c oxidase assembly protein subunit 15